MRVLVLLLSLSVGSQAHAQSARPDDVVLACKVVENRPAPPFATTLPTKNKAGGWCDPLELYYGTNGKPDYKAARTCALAEWHNPALGDDEGQLFWYAQAALAMIYANGAGVPRDVDRAIRIACGDPDTIGTSNDVAAMIAVLLKAKEDSSRRFDYCKQAAGKDGADDWILECDGIEYQLKQNRHDAPLRRAMQVWTPAQRAAYATMLKAHNTFLDARVPIGGACARGANWDLLDQNDNMRIELSDSVVLYDSGHLPHLSLEDYVEADRLLNHDYSAMIADLIAQQTEYCASQPDGLRDEERAWIKYRDAWVAFAKERWPQIPAESWRARLTRERIKELGQRP